MFSVASFVPVLELFGFLWNLHQLTREGGACRVSDGRGAWDESQSDVLHTNPGLGNTEKWSSWKKRPCFSPSSADQKAPTLLEGLPPVSH